MFQSTRLTGAHITTIRFQKEARVDQVTARLLEAALRTDLSLLSLEGDGNGVYPLATRDPIESASSWRAEMLWNEGASDVGRHLEVFVARANLFLDFSDGIQVASMRARPRSSSRKRARGAAAYGLDGSFGASLAIPQEP